MSEEETIKLLRSMICSADAPSLTDAVVDAFLLSPAQSPPETAERVRTLFVKKLFDKLHSEPVREIKEKWPFGRWVEAIRESFRLTRQDVCATLRVGPHFLERLENGDSPPWSFSPKEIADLLCLLRVHMSAVHQLVMNSLAVAKMHGLGPVSARSYSGQRTEVRAQAVKKALDLYLARNVSPTGMDQEVGRWMEEVRKSLERRQATYLLR